MADPKERRFVCAEGEDPKNPATKGAIATIYDADNGKSYYHLRPKNAELGALDKVLGKVIPEYKGDRSGAFSFSQPINSSGYNPLLLNHGVHGITVEFKDGKASECRIDTGYSGSSLIDIVDKPPGSQSDALAVGRKVSAAPSLDPVTMG